MGYRVTVLPQTIGKTEKPIDTKAYRRAEQRHLEQFHRLAGQRRALPLWRGHHHLHRLYFMG